MRYYHQTPTTYSTYEAPEDKSPLELRPSLEKGEETHVRDCLVWHSPSPRHTYRSHGYRMYTHNGRDYWTSESCGNPGCRTCSGTDHLIDRDIGYVRRNELGRTVDRGFSSKPHKLRMQDGELDRNWGNRYDMDPTASSDTARGLRDPFNRPINGGYPWGGSGQHCDCDKDGRWNGYKTSRGCSDCKTSRGCLCNGRGCAGCKDGCGGMKSGECPGCNGRGCMGCKGGNYRSPYNFQGPTVGSTEPYDLPTYRQTFPRIETKDPGSVSYRAPAPAINGYNGGNGSGGYMPGADDGGRQNMMDGGVGVGGFGGGQTYRPPPMDYQASSDDRPIGGGGGAGGGAAARGNDAIFPRKDDPQSMKPVGPRRELKGPKTAVAFTV